MSTERLFDPDPSGVSLRRPQNSFEQSFGVKTKIAITASADGDFRMVELLLATTITALETETTENSDALLNKELPPGTIIWDVQSITITSGGLALAHNKA